MRTMMVILIILIFVNLLFGAETILFQDLSNPHSLAVDENQIYITERSTVYIYSKNDFKLVKKFGKRGEGPGEFKGMIRYVYALKNDLCFNSSGKVSYFTKNGVFKEEFGTPHPDMKVKPLGKYFIGNKLVMVNGVLFVTINFYDRNFKRIKELHRQKKDVQLQGKGTRIFAHSLPFHTIGDKVFIANRNEFVIKVLDKNTNKLYDITYNYKKTKVTSKVKNQVINFLKTSPNNAPYFKSMQPIMFPEYFPAIKSFYVADGKVYVFTYNRDKDKNEVFIFDIKGKFLMKTLVPYAFKDPLDEYPATIKKGKLYQLIENEDTEEWFLHISKVD